MFLSTASPLDCLPLVRDAVEMADFACSLREDNVLLMLSKVMKPRSAVPNKFLQGCITEWERDIEFYAKATSSEGITPPQQNVPPADVLLGSCGRTSTTARRRRRTLP